MVEPAVLVIVVMERLNGRKPWPDDTNVQSSMKPTLSATLSFSLLYPTRIIPA